MQSLVKEVYRRTAKLSSSLLSKPPYITTELLEEERLSLYKRKEYYPVHIGDTYQSRYEVVGKLGYGGFSTTWLCHDHRWVLLRTACEKLTLSLESATTKL